MPLGTKRYFRKSKNVYVRESRGRAQDFSGVRLQGDARKQSRKRGVHVSGNRGTPRGARLSPAIFGGIFKRFRTAGILFVCASFLALILGSIGLVSLWLYERAVTSEFFATRHVDVTGNDRLSRDMVLEYAGIRPGANSLALSIGTMEKNLRATPWVEEVSVKRLLPNRFVIRLKERMPSFWVQRGDELFYANDRGEPIAPVESKNFLSLPTLTIESGAEEDSRFLNRLMKDVNNGALPIESGAISSVTVSPSKGVEIFLEDRDLRLSLATDDWDGNLARLGMALGDLSRRRELKNVREIRAVDGNVWVILNGYARG